MDGFAYDAGEALVRPAKVRRLTFDDVWSTGEHRAAAGVVPLELLEPGDTQAGVFRRRGGRPGDLGHPVVLDVLARHPAVDSVVGLSPVVARTPLPNVRWLAAGQTDEETLRNLPNLEALVVWSGIGATAAQQVPIQARALPASVRWLQCDAATFGSLDAVATQLPDVERLRAVGLWRGESAEPLAAFRRLRWLATDAAKGLQHLAKLSGLELLELDLAEATLADLQRFGKLAKLRVLRLDGGGLKSLAGIERLRCLEELSLTRTVVNDLSPLTGLPALSAVRLIHAPRVAELAPLGTLRALRRLEVRLGDITADQSVPTLGWLAGTSQLEELELVGVDVADRDPGPFHGLRHLRRAKLVGSFGVDEEGLRAVVPAQDLIVHVRESEDRGVAVGPVRYRQLPDGTWTIFANLAAQLGTANNHDAQDRARGAIRDEDLALHNRLVFDSEAGALAITATSEDDIRRAATVIATLAGAGAVKRETRGSG